MGLFTCCRLQYVKRDASLSDSCTSEIGDVFSSEEGGWVSGLIQLTGSNEIPRRKPAQKPDDQILAEWNVIRARRCPRLKLLYFYNKIKLCNILFIYYIILYLLYFYNKIKLYNKIEIKHYIRWPRNWRVSVKLGPKLRRPLNLIML